jgi:hypothetical protein
VTFVAPLNEPVIAAIEAVPATVDLRIYQLLVKLLVPAIVKILAGLITKLPAVNVEQMSYLLYSL